MLLDNSSGPGSRRENENEISIKFSCCSCNFHKSSMEHLSITRAWRSCWWWRAYTSCCDYHRNSSAENHRQQTGSSLKLLNYTGVRKKSREILLTLLDNNFCALAKTRALHWVCCRSTTSSKLLTWVRDGKNWITKFPPRLNEHGCVLAEVYSFLFFRFNGRTWTIKWICVLELDTSSIHHPLTCSICTSTERLRFTHAKWYTHWIGDMLNVHSIETASHVYSWGISCIHEISSPT